MSARNAVASAPSWRACTTICPVAATSAFASVASGCIKGNHLLGVREAVRIGAHTVLHHVHCTQRRIAQQRHDQGAALAARSTALAGESSLATLPIGAWGTHCALKVPHELPKGRGEQGIGTCATLSSAPMRPALPGAP